MKYIALICFWLLISAGLSAQESDSTKSWEASVSFDNNFLAKEYLAGVSGTFDYNWLHAEARYNQEDFRTASLWGGYNFSGGNKLAYTITPMAGFMFGSSWGFLPGVSISLEYKKWSFSNESAFVIYSSLERDQSYFYTSGEVDYTIVSTFYVGFAVTRSKIYQTKLDTQRGISAGYEWRGFSVSGSLYNLFFDQPLIFISLGYSF